jgi:hypothetical protein
MLRHSLFQKPVLLLGESKHPVFLKVDLGTLEKILPHLTCLEFRGLGHVAAWSYDRQRDPGGQPEPVAQELRFAEQCYFSIGMILNLFRRCKYLFPKRMFAEEVRSQDEQFFGEPTTDTYLLRRAS